MNNTSAGPIPSSNTKVQDLSKFLTFAQHLQYYKIDRKAFFSDLQGEFRFEHS